MASIDTFIDAATTGDKVRAAQFDDKPGVLPMEEWLRRDGAESVLKNLYWRAAKNLRRAETISVWAPFGQFDEKRRECLHDARNIEALILWVYEQDPYCIHQVDGAPCSGLERGEDCMTCTAPDHKEADGGE